MTFDWHKRQHGDMIEIASTMSLEDLGAFNLLTITCTCMAGRLSMMTGA